MANDPVLSWYVSTASESCSSTNNSLCISLTISVSRKDIPEDRYLLYVSVVVEKDCMEPGCYYN